MRKLILFVALVLCACGHDKPDKPPVTNPTPVSQPSESTTTTVEAPTTTLEVTTTTEAPPTTVEVPIEETGVWCAQGGFSPPCPPVPGFDPTSMCKLGDTVCSGGPGYVCKRSCNFILNFIRELYN